MKYFLSVVCAVGLIGWLALVSLAEESAGFLIIVHADNPVTEMSKKDLSKLFLKKMKTWKELDVTVEPIDLVGDSPVRERFSDVIHERKVASIKAYWQKEIFSGRAVPPVEKESDADVLDAVSKNSGAIGYVSESAAVADYKVKVITILE